MSTGNKVAVKSMSLLQLFEDNPSLSLNRIIELSGLPKTSVLRMLNSLESMGFLSKNTDRHYVLGLSLLHYGQLVADRLNLRSIALPFMYDLKDKTNEAVNLIIPDGNEAMYVEKVDTSQMVRVYTRIGRRAPYYAGACPRILLAFMDDAWISSYLERTELKRIASGTIIDRNELLDSLVKSRDNGYSISFSELEDGSASIAAPIRNHKNEVIAGLSIAGPDYRFKEYRDHQVVPLVVNTARQISERLGYKNLAKAE